MTIFGPTGSALSRSKLKRAETELYRQQWSVEPIRTFLAIFLFIEIVSKHEMIDIIVSKVKSNEA